MAKNKIYQILLVASSFFSISAASTKNDVKTHIVHFVGTHCTINGQADFNDTVISGKADLKYTIQPDDSYLPLTKDDIDCGGIDFDYHDGLISFPNPITQDIEITATCTETYQKEYDFTFNGEDCTINGETNYNSKIPYLKEEVKFTIVPIGNRKIASIIVEKGEGIVDVDEVNNIVTISKMTEEVKISATAINEKYNLSFRGINCSAATHLEQSGDMFMLIGDVGTQYSFTLSANDKVRYRLPDDIKVKIGDRMGVKGTDYEYKPNADPSYSLSFTLKDTTFIQAIAVLQDIKYKVQFDSNGGTAVETIEDIIPGTSINPPSDPTKPDCTFDGWYLDNAFKNKFNFASAISTNLKLYAKWIDNVNKVTVKMDAGRFGFVEKTPNERYYSFPVQKGTTWKNVSERLTIGAKPKYDFLYWTINGNRITDNTVINNTVELEAVYAPASEEYLTFIPINDNATLIVNEGNLDLSYKTSMHDTWIDITDDTKNITVSRGDRIFFNGKNDNTSGSVFNALENSYFAVSGLCKSIFSSRVLLPHAFENLFREFSGLHSAFSLLLPDTTLVEHCYNSMFFNCSALINAPTLPATTLADGCYNAMFNGCSSLVNAPTLPATKLVDFCYSYMFSRCSSLVNAPTLPATTLTPYCYENMFSSCSALVNAPTLPATTLETYCYYRMFYDCIKLTGAPELPATTLAPYCYDYMFGNCTSLVNAPTLPATTLAKYCYLQMFYDCSSLVNAPTLPATTLAGGCYADMFYNCISLVDAPTLPATTLASDCYYRMFYNCINLTGAPELPATTLASYCYGYMFQNCSSLVNAPTLPATTLASNCYNSMFIDCSRLTSAPELPATTLKPDCYEAMFSWCTSLVNAPTLPATTLANDCYLEMFYNCISLVNAPTLPATILAPGCYNCMFSDCASLKISQGKVGTKFFTCPDTSPEGCVYRMFYKTGGEYTGDPVAGNSYYWY